MHGRKASGLRSGDLAEGFGLQMLRAFAFIAPVPREEDFGVDGVATIFRNQGKLLYAERSFLVQVKSPSEKLVNYEGEAVDWLRKLELPMYFLKADKRKGKADLYSPCRATRHVNFRCGVDQISIEINDAPVSLHGSKPTVLKAGFGAPILSWTLQETKDKDFCKKAYDVLTSWVELDASAILSRKFGIVRQVTWETNRMPKSDDHASILQGPTDLPNILGALKLAYESSYLLTVFDDTNDDLSVALLTLREFMKRKGVDPDPHGTVAAMLKHRLQAKAKAAPQSVTSPTTPNTEESKTGQN